MNRSTIRLALFLGIGSSAIALAGCAPDHNYAGGPMAPTDITPEMAKARCRMMVEGRGSSWAISGPSAVVGPAIMAGMATGDPFPIMAENKRKAQVDTCMVAQGYNRAD